MCFVWISEQTAIISVYSSNWLVCTTEMECVHCAVGTGSLNRSQVILFFGLAMVQAVDRRPFTVKAHFLSRASLCEIGGSQSGTGTFFSECYVRSSPVRVMPCSRFVFNYMLLFPEGRQMGETWEASKK
jgi:hypothetical protein